MATKKYLGINGLAYLIGKLNLSGSEWQDITNDLNNQESSSSRGSLIIESCLVKRNGDVILMFIQGSLNISNASYTGCVLDCDTAVFDFGVGGGGIMLTTIGKQQFSFTYGSGQIAFSAINITATTKEESFNWSFAVPYYENEVEEEIPE
ncbi:MAG: hypothetical protein LBT56_02510 [Prevotellaceae bacterium]|jgi:hypothetical protein|nr:hypothetical protein [Prevotellaceae bacterium]